VSTSSRIVPVACAILAILWVAARSTSRSGGEMQLYEFGKTPVQDNGRIKPIDTVARVTLLAISGKQTWVDADDKTQPAIKWLLDVESGGPQGGALQERVFRITNEDVLGLLGLSRRKGYRYALAEFSAKLKDLAPEAKRVHDIDNNQRSPYEKSVAELWSHLQMYGALAQQDAPRIVPPPTGDPEHDRWLTASDVDDIAVRFVNSHWDQTVAQVMSRLGMTVKDLDRLPKDRRDEAMSLLKDKEIATVRSTISPPMEAWLQLLAAYHGGDTAGFNKALDNYRSLATGVPTRDVHKASFEAFLNDFDPFFVSVVLYVAAFVLVCLSWMGWHRPLLWSALALMAVGLAVHGFGLGGRMYLSDRWMVFVTNLYSSAVFIAFGAAVAGLILEAVFGHGIGLSVGSFLGFGAILVGGTLVKGEDTLEMMRAVLDTNFWLATHVTCVTLGYTATFVAGALGVRYILSGLFSPALRDREFHRSLGQALYGVICFAMLFSFSGTVLGGVWADQSWGRFWGWDPKENGALLIVLWNALILHARWCGLVKLRGMAVLTVVGNMITAWSWFGTNQLGIGLHSYGFDDGLSLGLTSFWASQLVLIALGLLPLKFWSSFSPRRAVS
jgi:ABC-type transport system involved in cytochrome c biogenesis permease subunit